MIVMPIPYNLRVTEEERIYQKMIEERDMTHVHIAPHALRVAAMFPIITRIKDSKKQGIDRLMKMRLYDGEDVEGYNEVNVNELKHEYPDEGMKGIDPRYVINRISSTMIRKEAPAINALDVLRSLKDGLDHHPSISNEDRDNYLNFISIARKEYDEIAKQEVQKAFMYSYEEYEKT